MLLLLLFEKERLINQHLILNKQKHVNVLKHSPLVLEI